MRTPPRPVASRERSQPASPFPPGWQNLGPSRRTSPAAAPHARLALAALAASAQSAGRVSPARSSPRPPPRRPSLSTFSLPLHIFIGHRRRRWTLPPSQLLPAGLLAHAASTRHGATQDAIAPRPSPPPTAAHTSATTLSCLARRHCTPLPPRAPLNRFARSSSSRWRSVHAGFARLTVSTPSYSPSPRPLGLPPRLSRRTPRAPLAALGHPSRLTHR